ncbi:MAG: FtsQ-type POTRA domain-containing protein [Pseudomonadota bacterium]
MWNRMGLALLTLTIAAIMTGAFMLLNRPIERVLVHGEFSGAEQSKIQQALAPYTQQGILTVQLDDIRAGMEELPWAQNLTLRRVWPDTLEVNLRRAQPIAKWGDENYVSPYGRLLSMTEDYAGLPQFNVALASPIATLSQYRLLNQIFEREQLTLLELNQSPIGEWEVKLKSQKQQMEVFLGGEEVGERAHRFLKFYRRVLQPDNRQVAYVDARYPSGIAVRFADQDIDAELLAQHSWQKNELQEETQTMQVNMQPGRY